MFDSARFAGYFDRFHIEENRLLVVDVGPRQQRVNQYATPRIDEKGVGQLTESEVDDFAEKRVDFYVSARRAFDFSQHEHRQALRNYHAYNIVR